MCSLVNFVFASAESKLERLVSLVPTKFPTDSLGSDSVKQAKPYPAALIFRVITAETTAILFPIHKFIINFG